MEVGREERTEDRRTGGGQREMQLVPCASHQASHLPLGAVGRPGALALAWKIQGLLFQSTSPLLLLHVVNS